LAYARVRYVGNSDFERTERQRIVMKQVFDKLKVQSIPKLYSILSDFLPKVTTNLTKGELFSLLLSVPVYIDYSLEQHRVPINNSYKGMMIGGNSVLGIDFTKNIEYLHYNIY
jgi:anionic cell wall polymer biosynthesis LytR-Cps2A-Psr (LCP) family protein